MIPMGDIFTQHGSDKNTFHSYGPIYDRLFPNREGVRSVLEVGIASGQSVLAWLEIFPNAKVLGIDKEPCHNAKVGSTDPLVHPLVPRPDRLEIKQADCRDVAGLKAAVGDRQFDLIVEDSSHQLDDNLRCLFMLYPHVAPGGIYVIEEMSGGEDGNAQKYRESWPLFNGLEIHETQPPNAGQWLVVVRKPAI